jgi:hypothetical protein
MDARVFMHVGTDLRHASSRLMAELKTLNRLIVQEQLHYIEDEASPAWSINLGLVRFPAEFHLL